MAKDKGNPLEPADPPPQPPTPPEMPEAGDVHVLFDDAAHKQLSDRELIQISQNALSHLENRFADLAHGDAHVDRNEPITEIETDNFIDIERTGRKVVLSLDTDELRIANDTGALPPAGSGERRFLAVIVGATLMPNQDARWTYTIQYPVVLAQAAGEYSFVVLPGNEVGTAINTAELAHAPDPGAPGPWYVWGVDVYGADYPDNFDPKPIGGGGTTGTWKYDVVVEVVSRITGDETQVFTFHMMGSHDGICDPASGS